MVMKRVPRSAVKNLAVPVFVTILVGCAAARPAPPPPGPSGVQEIAVAQPTNRTGGALVVEEPGWPANVIGETRSTVPDLLAADLRAQLTDRGFRLATPRSTGAPTLQVEIRRWELYSADYSTVTVDLLATLLEPSGRPLWSLERTRWSVPTRDARSSIDASNMAAEEIATTLIDGWQPASPAPK